MAMIAVTEINLLQLYPEQYIEHIRTHATHLTQLLLVSGLLDQVRGTLGVQYAGFSLI